MKVRFAVSVGLGPPDPESIAAAGAEAEARGFDTLWLSDVPSSLSTDPSLGVALLSGVTSRVRLGINLIPFGAAPYLVALRVAQLDRLTGGRLLLTLVPGLDLPAERSALGTAGRHRGRLMDDVVPKLRQWWSGSTVDAGEPGREMAVRLPITPLQQPLEVWLGGSGPEATERAGRLSDGWLGASVSPTRAGRIVSSINAAAAGAGRTIDPDHFGLSIGYARQPDDLEAAVRLRPARRGSADLSEVLPVGEGALRRLVGDLVDEGLSKFVLRPLRPPASAAAWSDELAWLADAVLDLQT